MHKMRSLYVGLAALMAVSANAQFDGPAPLAWRWLPPSGVAASGAPLVNGDTIYIASGGRVYAVDKTTGNKKWQFPAQDPIPGNFRTPPILANGVLVGVGDNKIIYGIDPENGSSKWSYVMPGAPLGQPIFAGGYVVQSQSDNKIVAVDPANGQPKWINKDTNETAPYNVFDGLTGQIAAYGQDVLYFTSKSELHCLDAVTELEVWTRPVKFTQLSAYAVPVVYSDNIYVASGQFLVCVNPATGAPAWQTPTGFNTSFAPTVSDAGVFVVSDDGKAMLYDLNFGKPTDAMPKPIALGSYPATKPSVVGNKFMVPTTSGALDLVDPATGSIVWSYVVRPIGTMKASTSTGNRPGGQGPGARGPAGGGGTAQRGDQEITEIQASGPAVLAGQTLLVPAQDSSLLAFDKDLGVDLTPPTVKMLFPNPGDQVAGLPPLLLYLKIRDEGSGVNEKTLKVSIDAKEYEATYKRDGSATVTFSSAGKNKPLADGRHVITVEVTDWIGNATKQTFAITIDNSLPPVKLPGQDTNTRPGIPGGPGGNGGKGGGGGFGGGDGG